MGVSSQAAGIALALVLVCFVALYGSFNQALAPGTSAIGTTSQGPIETNDATSSTLLVPTSSSYAVQETTPTNEELGPQWVSDFFSIVNSQRSTPLTESSTLDQFAAIRFNTLASHYEVTHYGFSDDFYSFFVGQGITVSEEYFYPNSNPSFYAGMIQDTAPIHWQGLLDPTYSYFGYYIGTGPVVKIAEPCSAPLEIVGEVNETQMLILDGCNFSMLSSPYFVIELSS